MIMASAIVSIVAAIAVANSSSGEHKKNVGVVLVLHDYAEAIMNATYQPCAAPTNINYTAPTGYTVSIKPGSIKSYDGTSNSPAAFNTCPQADNGAVQMTLQAQSTDGRQSRALQIVKAKDYVRPS